MNAPLRRVAFAVLVLFGLLLLNVNYLQVVRAGDLRDDPANSRTLFQRYDSPRGPIVAGNTTIAESVETNDSLRFLRRYPEGAMYAPVTGYYSLVYGANDLERQQDAVLSGDAASLVVRRLSDLLTGATRQGGTVLTTIVPEVQEAAYQALGNQRGAVVALDPKTGAILALVSRPSYDPNALSSHEPAKIRDAYERLTDNDNDPLVDRALSSRYPPGSTFKLVTTAAALSNGYQPSTSVPAPTELTLPQTRTQLRNFGGEVCDPSGRQSLSDALKISCNTAFAQLAVDLGADAMRQQAQAFGFDTSPQVPMQAAPSTFPDSPNPPQLAQSGIGQFDVTMTPLQGAMMVAGIANEGRVMTPYLVQEIQAPNLSTLDRARPETYKQAVEPGVARDLTTMMQGVVGPGGTGTSAQIPGVDVAGKTGTAQQGPDDPPTAWFTGFAPVDDPQIAVAVVVEEGGRLSSEATGGAVAAPVFKAAVQALLDSGEPAGGSR